MGLEIFIVIGSFLIVLFSICASGYALHRASKMFEEAKKDYVELLGQTIDNLKAQSLRERVEAKVIEKESDVRIEMLKDAIKAESDSAKVEGEPQYVTTADGREINLQDYEIV